MPRVRRCKYKGCHGFAMMPNYYCTKHIKYEVEYRAEREKYRKRQASRFTLHALLLGITIMSLAIVTPLSQSRISSITLVSGSHFVLSLFNVTLTCANIVG